MSRQGGPKQILMPILGATKDKNSIFGPNPNDLNKESFDKNNPAIGCFVF
jgi:hypothetical protein